MVLEARNMRLRFGPPKAISHDFRHSDLAEEGAVGVVAVHPVVTGGGPEPSGVVEAEVIEGALLR